MSQNTVKLTAAQTNLLHNLKGKKIIRYSTYNPVLAIMQLKIIVAGRDLDGRRHNNFLHLIKSGLVSQGPIQYDGREQQIDCWVSAKGDAFLWDR